MGLFTVELELGRETRAMIERVAGETRGALERIATRAVIQLELGPKTRETIASAGLPPKGGGSARKAIEGLLGKANDDETPG